MTQNEIQTLINKAEKMKEQEPSIEILLKYIKILQFDKSIPTSLFSALPYSQEEKEHVINLAIAFTLGSMYSVLDQTITSLGE